LAPQRRVIFKPSGAWAMSSCRTGPADAKGSHIGGQALNFNR
jgi:hypothetical protein